MSGKFKTIARFQYSTEAQIVKGRLEAEGIQVFLSDNLTIDADPLVSNAIGGVKLKVLSRDALKAQYILQKISQFAIDDEGNRINCPECNGINVQLFSTIKGLRSFLSFVFGVIFGKLPIHANHKYRCHDCNSEFDIK